jgi:hypothetical protein
MTFGTGQAETKRADAKQAGTGRAMTGQTAGETVLGLSPGSRLVLIAGVPALGVVLGFFLPSIADWAEDQRWLPMRGPFEVIASFEGRWVALTLAGAGLLLGLALAGLAIVSCLKVTLTDLEIRLDKDGSTRRIPAPEVGAVFVDGKQLVILDTDSRELLCEAHESGTEQLARGFRAHGYPWAKSDPHAAHYRRWVPDTPDLPPAVNALLKARESALKRKDGDDIRELREEIQKLGFVVRDTGSGKQHWRPLVRP